MYTADGLLWDATATDNCNVRSGAYVLTGATTGTGTSLDNVIFNDGETTVTWTALDDTGNDDVCFYTVTVNDDEAPEITCVTNQVGATDAGVCTYTHDGLLWDATATDNCNVASVTYVLTGATTGTGTSLDNVIFNDGVTTVKIGRASCRDNDDVCFYTVTVNDDEAPEITCVTNQVVITDAGVCTYTHDGLLWDATATDNCNVASVTYVLTGATTGTGTSLDNVIFNDGVTTV